MMEKLTLTMKPTRSKEDDDGGESIETKTLRILLLG
jgi:hypothetical protein